MANLALRFFLEIAGLVGLGLAPWSMAPGLWRWPAVIGVPLLAAFVWGVFAVPDDPSRSGGAPVPVPGWLRLVIEFAVLGSGFVAYALAGYPMAAALLAGLMVLHYALSNERIAWLLSR